MDAEIKSRGTFLNMFSLIVTQETDSVMGLAGASRGGRCLFRRNWEGREKRGLPGVTVVQMS